jgi:hypothetical protein
MREKQVSASFLTHACFFLFVFSLSFYFIIFTLFTCVYIIWATTTPLFRASGQKLFLPLDL